MNTPSDITASATSASSARAIKVASVLSKTIRFLRWVAVVAAAALVVAALVQAIIFRDGAASNAGIPFFLEMVVVISLYAVILYQLERLFQSAVDNRSLFVAGQARRVRVMALCLLALVVGGFSFSCALVFVAHNVAPSITFGIAGAGFYGFPSGSLWSIALDAGASRGALDAIPSMVAIDIAGLLQAALVWCLSYAFDLGQALQEEVDYTL